LIPLAVEEDVAPGGRVEAGDAVEERRLPRAVGADQAEDHPLLDGEGDVVVGAHPPKYLLTLRTSRSAVIALRLPAQPLDREADQPVGHGQDHHDDQDPVDEQVGLRERSPERLGRGARAPPRRSAGR